MYPRDQLRMLVLENNLIEGWSRDDNQLPTDAEIAAAERILALPTMSTDELCRYQQALCPGCSLREHPGLDVQINGNNVSKGGPNIRARLDRIIERANGWDRRGAERALRSEHLGGERTSAEIASAIEQRVGEEGNPWEVHIRFALLHPFVAGNGRTGRMLWLWQMRDQDLQKSFLHQFYCQTIANTGGK